MSKTLLVYDLETSGLTPFDQVLAYAAIRVDAQTLEEIDREEIHVQWRRDTVPSPQAYLVHQIPVQRSNTVTEAEGVCKIHQSLNKEGTHSGGYNTLGFDDEMLRFSFYRTLLPPYTHQYQSGCGRFDVLPMVVFYYLYSPDSLQWPLKPDGRPSFKLEDISAENGWAGGRAHDAMNDVLATVALMRHLRLNKPMWDYLMGYFDKYEDERRIANLMQQPKGYQGVGIMVDLRFGYDANYHVPVLHVGPHHQYKNQTIFLRLDKPIEEVSESVLNGLIIKKKLAEPGFVLPYSDRYREKIPEDVQRIVEKNLALLQQTDMGELRQHCRHQALPVPEYIDLDAMLYHQSFLTRAEQLWCEQFHLAQTHGHEKLLNEMPNESLRLQALRFLWRFHPEQIPHKWQQDADKTIADFIDRAIDYRNRPRLTIEEALLQLEQASQQTTNPGLLAGLAQLKTHIEKMPSF